LFGYELWSLTLAVVAGVACGFLNTVASSGSAVSLPVLMMIGLDPITANATNRIPLLLGSISATWSFSNKKALPWALAIKVSIPTSIGAIVGARLIELFPDDVGLIITAAILLALALLFPGQAGDPGGRAGAIRFGLRGRAVLRHRRLAGLHRARRRDLPPVGADPRRRPVAVPAT
jgi:uncharacterized membrane protein YfcA